MTTTQVPVPVQSVLQPTNVEGALGVAVNVTDVPCGNSALQVAPQLMAGGSLVIVPLPVAVTMSSICGMVDGGGLVLGGGTLSEPPHPATQMTTAQANVVRCHIVVPSIGALAPMRDHGSLE